MEIRELPSTEWPSELLEIPHLPEKLWLRGTLPEPAVRRLAVVGSRALTPYGREACQKLIQGLRWYPVSIVSGLALGADACAHQAALDAGMHTIAVPGSGLADVALYPRANARLAQAILDAGGALLSEHEPEHRARPYDFPARNRLMVGLSHAVLMIEAGERSGTLITARLAGDYNRELLCVPHRIGDAHAAGAHQFIRLGATLVSESAHILEALQINTDTETPEADPATVPALSPEAQVIWDLLAEPLERDALLRAAQALGSAPHETLALLMELEVRGMLVESFGLWRRV